MVRKKRRTNKMIRRNRHKVCRISKKRKLRRKIKYRNSVNNFAYSKNKERALNRTMSVRR